MSKFLSEESGTATVEYLVLGALVIAIGVVAVRTLLSSAAGAGDKAKGGIDSIGSVTLGG